jgi:hypothetical protein
MERSVVLFDNLVAEKVVTQRGARWFKTVQPCSGRLKKGLWRWRQNAS